MALADVVGGGPRGGAGAAVVIRQCFRPRPARFSLHLRTRYPARVVLTLRDGATVLAVSRTLHVGPR